MYGLLRRKRSLAQTLRVCRRQWRLEQLHFPMRFIRISQSWRMRIMGRYLLLWLLGVPIPILVLIYAFGGLH
jgi:hypothetical protein